ncbi:Bark storage protein a [Thalictrum thalictroides]|uniref:Bark storage protein a n=1 Tax=Thalictrum thalictroides TaxID=46969 RepID=A0A7J6WA54_THATH|nr:Bark storage protein a [Thalictrum thalictroides]
MVLKLCWMDLKVPLMSLLIILLDCSSTATLKLNHPLREVIDRVNEKSGPYIGLVMAYSAEEHELQSSGIFIPNSISPWVDLSGRRFNIGSIREVNVIYVMSGQRRLNAGITVQILLDVFDIRGIVHYGTAGSANDSLSFGDVSIPKYVAFTGSWNWKKFNSEKSQLEELNFGEYDLPQKGQNLLRGLEFKTEEFYSVGEPMKQVFWLEIDPLWFSVAAQLRDFKLQQCVNVTYCLPETPKVVYGLKGSTADIFVDNAAYRKFLYKKFHVSTVDEESAAVVMTAMSSNVPCIVIRGVSDLAGGEEGKSSTSLSSLAAKNALNVAVEYIKLVGPHF